MENKQKNKHAVALGRLGGKVKSQAKTEAAKKNIQKRWERIKNKPLTDSNRLVYTEGEVEQ